VLLAVALALAGIGACAPAGSTPGAARPSTPPGPTASAPPPSPAPAVATQLLRGRVLAGPTCPVARPGQSGCDDRPVAGARIDVTTAAGAPVATLVSDAGGMFSARLAPGRYVLTPQPVEGLMGTAQPIEVNVAAGQSTAELTVSYDTGIR
jgi:hypothetical protein